SRTATATTATRAWSRSTSTRATSRSPTASTGCCGRSTSEDRPTPTPSRSASTGAASALGRVERRHQPTERLLADEVAGEQRHLLQRHPREPRPQGPEVMLLLL